MTDPRPRPKYGEYASPEVQAKAIGTPAEPPPPTAPPAPLRPYSPAATAVPRPRRWNVVLSVALLAYGLINIIGGFFQFSDPASLLNDVYAAQGIGTFTPSALATALGVVINVSSAVLWIIAAAVTGRLLRRNRLAFYVPVIAGVVASIVVGVCLLVLMFSDPAFTTYVNGQG
ncbi:MAG TPA: DUF6264 family protein [Lacisediminihabitans sp.]|uniref:DUF6264 family protein n=1 Tax=Lacisediminihabitans sp. TaxID=2787631 RepID=UPI002ED93924